MQGKPKANTHEEYIAEIEETRREGIQRLHDLIRETPDGEYGM